MSLLILFTVVMGLTADWYHRKLIAEYLEPFIARKHNAIITMPPGMGKTALVICTVVMIFIKDLKAHVIVLSNADGLAAMIVRNCLRWVNNEQIQLVRPIELSKATETEFTIEGNDGRPSCLGAGTKTVLVGARCNYLIVDDGVKDQAQALSEEMNLLWDRYTTVAESRLMAGGVVLVVGTRWGISDLIGRVIRRALDNKKARQFQVINLALTNKAGRDSFEFHTSDESTMRFEDAYQVLSTIADQPFSVGTVDAEQREADKGPVGFQMMDQGKPTSTSSQLFNATHFPVVKGYSNSDIVAVFQSYDTSMGSNRTSDPSAGVDGLLMRDGHILMTDCFEEVMVFGLQKAVIAERYFTAWKKYEHQPLLIIEKASTGEPIARDLISDYGDQIAVELHPVTKEKYLRGVAVQGTIVARTVHVYEQMPLLSKFLSDMANYPLDAKNDHIPDAACQLIAHIRKLHIPVENAPHTLLGSSEERQRAADIERYLSDASYCAEVTVDAEMDSFDERWR